MSDELDSPIDARKEAEAHLAELETFLKGRVHTHYVAARLQEIRDNNDSIIANDPVTRQDEIEQFKIRGENRCLEQMKSIFEDARETLKVRIEEMLERENKIPTTKE